jgi:UDPglucose 6-dehydrogenase
VAGAREAASGADALIVLTDWDEFRSIDFVDIAAQMEGNVVADLRNVLDAEAVRSAGLRYLSVGRRALG